MSIKTILVHLNDERRTEQLLTPVADIARRFNAHVIGLHVYAGVPASPPVALPYAKEVLGAALAAERKESEAIKAAFERVTVNQPFVAEWHSVKAPHADLAEVVMRHARAADLIVASQTDPSWDMAPVLDFPERLAIESGRPVLVVPNEGTHDRVVGRNAVLAWNGKREAARAAFDALPLLLNAETVHIVGVAEGGSRKGELLADTSIAAALARHGVKAVATEHTEGSAGVAGDILSQVDAAGAGLLVMGAYGHARFREFVFGGVTRSVMRTMTVPTLFSH